MTTYEATHEAMLLEKPIRFEDDGDILFSAPRQAAKSQRRILAVGALPPGSDKPEMLTPSATGETKVVIGDKFNIVYI